MHGFWQTISAPTGFVIIRQDVRLHLKGHNRFLSVFDGMVATFLDSMGAAVAWLLPVALLLGESGGGAGGHGAGVVVVLILLELPCELP